MVASDFPLTTTGVVAATEVMWGEPPLCMEWYPLLAEELLLTEIRECGRLLPWIWSLCGMAMEFLHMGTLDTGKCNETLHHI